MTGNSSTWSGLARVVGGVALMACLAGLMPARTLGAAPGRWAFMGSSMAPADIHLGRSGGPPVLATGHQGWRPSPAGARRLVGPPGRPASPGRTWATLPAGLRAALARQGLGVAGTARRGAVWAPAVRGLRPSAVRPSCQCGGGPLWSQQAVVTASNGMSGDNFSGSVALSSDGNFALIGAPSANNGTGAAYVFENSGGNWWQVQELTANDGASGDGFGCAVALSNDGTTLLIGAPYKYGYNGAAYVFVSAGAFGWGQQAELTDGGVDYSFGSAVALSGDGATALIGAPVNDYAPEGVYVYGRSGSTWSQVQRLTASDGVPGDDFGWSVALSSDGTTALIGAPDVYHNTVSPDPGTAYIFGRSGAGWSQQAELTASDGAPADDFGYAVALSSNGTTALISAIQHNNQIGAVYVFASFFGWSQQAELTPSMSTTSLFFGSYVALSGDGTTALIGVPNYSYTAGATYVYQGSWSTWARVQVLSAAGCCFGAPVALSNDGTTLLIGASSTIGIGAAYIFSTSPTPPPTNTPTSAPTNTPTNTPALPTNTPTSTPTNTPVPLTNTPTSTPTPAASLVSSAASGAPFQTITITGTGFGPAETVKLFWDSASTPLTTATTQPNGSFVVHLSVPQAVAGAHTLKATGQNSNRTASTPFQIKPAVFLTPAHGMAGSAATMVGAGFGGGETVTALWYPGLKPLKSGPSNALGTVALSVTVPLSATGSYAVVGYGLTIKLYAATPFQVTP